MGSLLPLITETLQDQSSTAKREVALRTLGLLCRATGYVVTPFLDSRNLLDVFLNLVKTERSLPVRREVTKVLGILGAVDPYKHKIMTGRGEIQTSEDKTSMLTIIQQKIQK